MESVVKENKKEKMETTFNLKRKHEQFKSKIPIELKKSRTQREKNIFLRQEQRRDQYSTHRWVC